MRTFDACTFIGIIQVVVFEGAANRSDEFQLLLGFHTTQTVLSLGWGITLITREFLLELGLLLLRGGFLFLVLAFLVQGFDDFLGSFFDFLFGFFDGSFGFLVLEFFSFFLLLLFQGFSSFFVFLFFILSG